MRLHPLHFWLLHLLLQAAALWASPCRAGTVLAWGNITTPPATLQSNVVALSGGQFFCLALKDNGTVVGWGSNNNGQTNPPAGLNQVTKIAAGQIHGLALKTDGTMAAWGSSVPAGLSNAIAISAGNSFNLALMSNGTVAAWGSNFNGQTNVPADVTNIIAVAAGYLCCLALRADGTIATWGGNNYGQLNVPAGLSNVVAISAGERHALALKNDGTVVAWGDDSWGQCDVPPGLTNVATILAAGLDSFAVSSNGQLTIWGDNNAGELNPPAGINSVVAIGGGTWFGAAVIELDHASPIILNQPTNLSLYVSDTAAFQVTAIGAQPLNYQWLHSNSPVSDATNLSLTLTNLATPQGGGYSVVISNNYGAITSSVAALTVTDSKPVILSQPPGQGVNPGDTAAIPVVANGTEPLAYQWYFNDTNAIPDATNATLVVSNVTKAKLGYYSVNITNPKGSTLSSNALLAFLNVVIWGQTNSYGLAAVPKSLTNATAVAAGDTHGVALKPGGRIVVWGSNIYGQTNVPANATNVMAIAAAYYHTVVLRSNGTVIAWGDAGTNVPAGLSNIMAVAAGATHSLTLLSNGTVMAWGTGTGTNVPVGLSNIVAIAGGQQFSVALRSNGSAVAWGGGGSTNSLTNLVAIAANEFIVAGLRTDGKMVGNGSFLSNVPILGNVVQIGAFRYDALALRSDGTLTNTGGSSVPLPAGLSNVTAVACSQYIALGIIGDVPQPAPIPFSNVTYPPAALFSITLTSQYGRLYWLEYKNSVTDNTWVPLLLNRGMPGAITLKDLTSTNQSRFYRVRIW